MRPYAIETKNLRRGTLPAAVGSIHIDQIYGVGHGRDFYFWLVGTERTYNGG